MLFKHTKASLILFLIFFASNLVQLKAQNCGESGPFLKTPKVFNNYTKLSELKKYYNNRKAINTRKTGEVCWTVYADRDNVPVFKHYNRGSKVGELDFLEKVFVNEVKYDDSLMLKVGNAGDNNQKEKGWVNANNVILSNYSALNQQSIPKKRLVLFSLDVVDTRNKSAIESLREKSKSEFYNYYNSPSEDAEEIGQIRKFNIYFVLKRIGSWVLLSRSDKFKGESAGGSVLGWIKVTNTTDWNHRVAYEPVYGAEAKNKYNNSSTKKYDKYKLPVFLTQNSHDKFTKEGRVINPQKNIIKDFEVRESRMEANLNRLPVLKNFSSTKKKVVTVSQLGKDKVGREERARLARKKTRLLNKKENVNVLFVVDATESMEPYYDPIRRSIIDIIENKVKKQIQTNLRFGLALYRDYSHGKKKFSITHLTSDEEEITRELRTVQHQSNKDTDLPEAQYYGLTEAMRRADFEKQNSNVVVLVGDAGNHREDPKGLSKKDVVDKIDKYNASLIAFQVYRGNHLTFDAFNYDVQHYLKESAKRSATNESDVNLIKADYENTYKLQYPEYKPKEQDLFMFGRYTYASGDKQMDPDILGRNVVSFITNYLREVQSAVNFIRNVLEGYGGGYNEEMISALKANGYSDQDIATLKKLKEVTAEGYISTNYYFPNNNAFKPVVFMSENEKGRIIELLNNLIHNSTNEKRLFQKYLVEQCRTMLSGETKVSKKVVMDKTMNEVWQILLNVPFKGYTRLKNVKLRNITSIRDKNFARFYEPFTEQVRNFTSKQFEDSEFELGNQTFYWIPLEDFPGNG